MDPKERIVLALDMDGFTKAVNTVEQFRDHVTLFKVGSELFTAVGPRIVEEINKRGKKVFLDLKYYDIPTTVQKSAVAAADLGIFMLTLHTLGGLEMMRKASHILTEVSLKKNVDRPKLLGVTILTSMDDFTLREELGIGKGMKDQVRHLAQLALHAELDGVVSSPLEIEEIRKSCGKDFLIVTPGIRPSGTSADEQQRIMSPSEAFRRGADYLVMGRAILSQPDPLKTLERIAEELRN